VKPEFNPIFIRLRSILEPYAARLKVTADAADHYCLELAPTPNLKKAFPAAWVMINKNYVSYHFMPVYMFPSLRESMSPQLRSRMQGKSCFNFKALNETLFKELEKVTAEGFAMAKKSGVAAAPSAQK
jgi:hypothetical protein